MTSCDESSLRTALSGGGLVTFACSGTITVTAANGGTITISSDTTIDGTGQNVILSGGGVVGVFYVLGVRVNLNKLTITNGAGRFGGIENDKGILTVSNSTFAGNNGTEAGGIENDAGMLTVRNSRFSGNSGGEGGAIENDGGRLVVSNSTFSGNSGGFGGGIMNHDSGTGSVSNSAFTGNSSPDDGGGIENDGGSLDVSDDTFEENTSNEGGGIENDGGTCNVRNSTFSHNHGLGVGGGIESRFGTLTVVNSTLSGNTSGEFGGIVSDMLTLSNTLIVNACDNRGVLTDGGGNLNWQVPTCPGINVDPKLDTSGLQYNGGSTMTLALQPGSPAATVSAPLTVNCPIADQRGFPRPFTSPCSIGAYEPGILFKGFHVNDDATSVTAQSFTTAGTFSLGATSNGIHPLTEIVQFRFGSFSTVLPAGSFAAGSNGSFVHSGATFQMTIQPLGGSLYSFRASANGQNMAGTASPVQLTVGDDGGTTQASDD